MSRKEVRMIAKEPPVVALPTIEALSRHVQETLCAHDLLDIGQTPFFQSLVTRSEKVCGLFFQVQGPRQVRNYAVWAGNENRILFYDGSGQRFAEVRLSESPDPRKLSSTRPQS
jgi:hypothetical protein